MRDRTFKHTDPDGNVTRFDVRVPGDDDAALEAAHDYARVAELGEGEVRRTRSRKKGK